MKYNVEITFNQDGEINKIVEKNVEHPLDIFTKYAGPVEDIGSRLITFIMRPSDSIKVITLDDAEYGEDLHD